MNPDASHFCGAPGSDASARHARAAPDGWSGSAVRRHVGSGGGHARRSRRRSRSGRGRNSRRSAPGRGSPRTQTAGLTRASPCAGSADAPVDERLDCRDTGSACVPSTVWGTASSKTAKFRLGAVLAPRYRQALTPLSPAASARVQATPGRQISRPHSRQKSSAAAFNAPDLRGFRPPSTRQGLGIPRWAARKHVFATFCDTGFRFRGRQTSSACAEVSTRRYRLPDCRTPLARDRLEAPKEDPTMGGGGPGQSIARGCGFGSVHRPLVPMCRTPICTSRSRMRYLSMAFWALCTI